MISALGEARRAEEQAEELIRELLAYGREFVQPRPYTLGDLGSVWIVDRSLSMRGAW
ncbi:hypothetical protein [Actinoplanes teichomyceticus]|uniref:Uncharacterized protein n=1 Tax=Actinoplanes teichomyceticus TaxID=1867 RepID=A0A561WC00_ACTTI|nr:hypothetical protein [Actinoplanes teichomyceticus]TWG21400.1 hypothetical protein FHX34_103938 [Actinoplanes teichomyceticus]